MRASIAICMSALEILAMVKSNSSATSRTDECTAPDCLFVSYACLRLLGIFAASKTSLILTDLSFGTEPVIISSSPSIALKSSSNSRLIAGAALKNKRNKQMEDKILKKSYMQIKETKRQLHNIKR